MANDDQDVWGLTTAQHKTMGEIFAWWERNPKGPQIPGQPQPRFDRRPPIVCTLLADLEAGQSVPAVVLRRLPNNYNRQMLTAYGNPPIGYFRLGFAARSGGTVVWTPNIYPNVDSPATIQKYLQRIEAIGTGNVEVTLGQVVFEGVTYNLWNWEIVFQGKFAGAIVPLLQADVHFTSGTLLVRSDTSLEMTSQVESVSEVLGVPTPTPLKAGARAMCNWFDDVGYCIHACQVRDFGDYGLFG